MPTLIKKYPLAAILVAAFVGALSMTAMQGLKLAGASTPVAQVAKAGSSCSHPITKTFKANSAPKKNYHIAFTSAATLWVFNSYTPVPLTVSPKLKAGWMQCYAKTRDSGAEKSSNGYDPVLHGYKGQGPGSYKLGNRKTATIKIAFARRVVHTGSSCGASAYQAVRDDALTFTWGDHGATLKLSRSGKADKWKFSVRGRLCSVKLYGYDGKLHPFKVKPGSHSGTLSYTFKDTDFLKDASAYLAVTWKKH